MNRISYLTRLGPVVAVSLLVAASAVAAAQETAPGEEAPAAEPGPAPADQPAAPANEDAADEEFLNQPAGGEAGAGAAGEDGASGDSSKDGAGEEEERKRDHFMQGFVNVLFGTGWYMVAPYKDNKNDPKTACGPVKINNQGEEEGEPVCSGRSAMHLDFLGGFGVLEGIEVFAMFRLGLEKPNQWVEKPRLIGAGIKAYSPSDGLFKIAFGVAPLFDFTERATDTKYDFLVHVPIAAHFDFIPWLGAYLQAAPNISFISEFKLDITFGLGVQGRFP